MRTLSTLAMLVVVLLFSGCDKEKHRSVKIGNQTWMAENLNDPSKGGGCYEDEPENCEKYGRLYTWVEAMKACPSGWHLPSNAEWEAIVTFAGGMNAAGGKLKAKSGWDYDGVGTDEYGFSALPGGYFESDAGYIDVGEYGSWWSATEDSAGSPYRWRMSYSSSEVFKNRSNESEVSYSIRCIKEAK